MEINNCPKCGSETVSMTYSYEIYNVSPYIHIKCDNCHYAINGIFKEKLINEWNKKMYKCPACNTPLNESMFCVKCCSKWTKIEPGKEKQEETLDNFLEGFINFVDGLGGKKETIEDAEIEWSDIDSITNLPKTSKQLAEEHWGYIEALLKAHEEEYNIKQIEFHYKSAFIHGYKHAIEDK